MRKSLIFFVLMIMIFDIMKQEPLDSNLNQMKTNLNNRKTYSNDIQTNLNNRKTNLKANKLEVQIVDAHIYKNQIESIKEYLIQPIFNLPKYKYNNENLELINYQSGPKITAKVAV